MERQGEPGSSLPPEVRWTLGCLVAAAATVGLFILVLLVASVLNPPRWLQVLLGVGLVAAGAGLAWLVASALGQRAQTSVKRRSPPPSRRPPADPSG